MSTENARPWYKQFWPWFVIALPMTSVVAASTCVYIAFKHQDAVVQDDWDENSTAVNAAIDREHEAGRLGLMATLVTDDASGEVSLALTGKLTQLPGQLELKISHPTDPTRDQLVKLIRQTDGKYHGALSQKLNGRYYLALDSGNWRLTDMRSFPQKTVAMVANQ
jgi:hypothetical protein